MSKNVLPTVKYYNATQNQRVLMCFYYKKTGIVRYLRKGVCKAKNEFSVLHQNFTLLSTNQIAFHINKLLWDKRKKAQSEPAWISKTLSIVYEN